MYPGKPRRPGTSSRAADTCTVKMYLKYLFLLSLTSSLLVMGGVQSFESVDEILKREGNEQYFPSGSSKENVSKMPTGGSAEQSNG